MFLIIEGLDRTGKSTVAKHYEAQGFKVIHFPAPDKKFFVQGYSGPSYADEILDILMENDGKDVVFDRSWYGEQVWPYIYNRKAQLSEDDLEVFKEFEDRNSTERVLLIDNNTAAHWKRCVDNREPMNQAQFKLAGTLFNKMANKYEFVIKQLGDFNVKLEKAADNKPTNTVTKQETANKEEQILPNIPLVSPVLDNKADESKAKIQEAESETLLKSIEKANAIRDLLSKRLIKQKGGAFDDLEADVRGFLQGQLKGIFHKDNAVSLSADEVQILKVFIERLKEKNK